MNIGDRIKKRRLELGIDAGELGKKIGKSRATIYRYENGEIEKMPTTVLEPIATALKTTPAALMGWTEETNISSKNTIVSQVVLSEAEQKLINLWNNATEESRKTVLMVLESNQIIKKDEAM